MYSRRHTHTSERFDESNMINFGIDHQTLQKNVNSCFAKGRTGEFVLEVFAEFHSQMEMRITMGISIIEFHSSTEDFYFILFYFISRRGSIRSSPKETDFILPCNILYTKEKPWYKYFLSFIHTLMEKGNFQVIMFFLTKSKSDVLFYCSKCLVVLKTP